MKLILSNKAHFIRNTFFSSSTSKALNHTFIFIPGLGCDERIWGKVNDGLNRIEQGNILYTPYEGKTIPEFASFILKQCEVASYKELYIAGHSLGANHPYSDYSGSFNSRLCSLDLHMVHNFMSY